MRTLVIGMTAVSVSLCLTFAPIAGASDDDHATHANHGFVILGERDPHLYHLARFNSPHQWQGIFQVALKDANGENLDLSKLRRLYGQVISLASSQRFDLVEWSKSAGEKEIEGDIYKGYLRDPDKVLIAGGIKARLIKTEYLREIRPDDPRAGKTNVILSCDSKTDRFFGFHQVNGAPGFEEIMTIDALYQGSPDECCSTRIKCDSSFQGTVAEIQEYAGDRPVKSDSALHGDMEGRSFGFFNLTTIIFDDRALGGWHAPAPSPE